MAEKKGTLADKVNAEVKTLDFDKLGRGVSDERISRKVQSTQRQFDQIYLGQQAGIYSLDSVAMKDAPEGTNIYKIEPIANQTKAENIADQMGIYLAKKHHRKLANNMEKLRQKLDDKDFDDALDETEESIMDELRTARNELQKIGFNWQDSYDHLMERGLTDALRDSIKESYGQRAPSFEASKYIAQITDAHKPQLIEHLKSKHDKFVKYKLDIESIDKLRNTFAQVHSIYDRHTDPKDNDLLQKDMYDAFKHLYKAGAVEPQLKKSKDTLKLSDHPAHGYKHPKSKTG
jgi:3-dehydroquinate dehydratase